MRLREHPPPPPQNSHKYVYVEIQPDAPPHWHRHYSKNPYCSESINNALGTRARMASQQACAAQHAPHALRRLGTFTRARSAPLFDSAAAAALGLLWSLRFTRGPRVRRVVRGCFGYCRGCFAMRCVCVLVRACISMRDVFAPMQTIQMCACISTHENMHCS